MTEKQSAFSVGLGITTACNMECDFCYSVDRREEVTNLPLDTWMNFFRRNSRNIRDINFGTGENTLVDAYYELTDFIHALDPSIGQALTTNGTLAMKVADDPKKDVIISRSLSDIDVSLDYADPTRHNTFRGHPRAHAMALDTLQYSQDRGFNTTVVVMGIDDNLTPNNLEGIFRIADNHDAIVRINVYRPVNPNNGLRPPSLQTLINVFDWIHEEHLIASMSDPLFSAIFTEQEAHPDPSGVHSVRILPDGSVYPSTYLIQSPFTVGHITDEDLFTKVKNSLFIRSLTNTVPGYCGDCEAVSRCGGGALDRRILWNGTADTPDPYCPSTQGLPVRLRSYRVGAEDFSSIHDGYLPTMFFQPRRK